MNRPFALPSARRPGRRCRHKAVALAAAAGAPAAHHPAAHGHPGASAAAARTASAARLNDTRRKLWEDHITLDAPGDRQLWPRASPTSPPPRRG